MSQAKQRDIPPCVLPLKQAVYQACKKEHGTIAAIAATFGCNPHTLSLQINPNRDGHTLPPETIEMVIDYTKDTGILDSICAAHGNAGWFLLPDDDTNDQTEYMKNLGELGQKFGEMLNTAVNAHADAVITPAEYDEIAKVSNALMATIKALTESARKNMEANKS